MVPLFIIHFRLGFSITNRPAIGDPPWKPSAGAAGGTRPLSPRVRESDWPAPWCSLVHPVFGINGNIATLCSRCVHA